MSYFLISNIFSIIVTVSTVLFFFSLIKQGSMGGGGDPGAFMFLFLVLSLVIIASFTNGLIASAFAWRSGASTFAQAAVYTYAGLIVGGIIFVVSMWNS